MKFGIAADAAQADGHAPLYQVDMAEAESRMIQHHERVPIRRERDHNALYWLFGKFRRREDIQIIESPKPKGKRARRRERGRLKGEARLARARNQQSFRNFAKLL